MAPEVLNRFIQIEDYCGEMFLFTRHMSQFCQPIVLEVSPVGWCGGRVESEFILRIPIALLSLDLTFIGTVYNLCKFQCFVEALWIFCSRGI